MDTKEYTLSGVRTTLQVAVVKDIPAGNFNLGKPFLIKNITEDNITCQIKPAGQNEYVTTVIYPGWNPELCSEVLGVQSNTLQYGY